MENFHPEKTNVDRSRRRRGWHWFLRDDNFPMLHVPSRAANNNYIILNVVNIRRQSESMVNRTRINSVQIIFFGISPIVKHYQPLPSPITCWCVVSWFSGWYWFLSNVCQPIRINYFTWKYNIIYDCITGKISVVIPYVYQWLYSMLDYHISKFIFVCICMCCSG